MAGDGSLWDGVVPPIDLWRTGDCPANCLRFVSFFIDTFEFMVAFLSFWGRPIRVRSFHPKQRISFFEGLQNFKFRIGRYLASIFVFKFEDGTSRLKATERRGYTLKTAKNPNI